VHYIQPIFEVLAHYLPPGTLTLILGVLAAVSALPKVAKTFGESFRKHAAAILVFCAIAALEIRVIRFDRQEQDTKHGTEMEIERQRFDKVLSSLQGTQGGLTVQINAANALNRLAAKNLQAQEKSEERQVKIRALELSQNIGQFVTQAEMQISSLPTPPRGLDEANDPRWKDWYSRLENIEHNAVAEFHMRFGASVKDAVTQLRARGVMDYTDCDGRKDRPGESQLAATSFRFIYVLGCAQDLERAASKLP